MFSEGWRPWYDALKKPRWTPSSRTIGLVWAILYPVIFFTLIYVIYMLFTNQIGWLTALPFIVNLIFNFAFTPILFRLRNLNLASIDIVIVWLTIIWELTAIYPYSQVIAILQLPYLTWVTIAASVQLTITWMNRKARSII